MKLLPFLVLVIAISLIQKTNCTPQSVMDAFQQNAEELRKFQNKLQTIILQSVYGEPRELIKQMYESSLEYVNYNMHFIGRIIIKARSIVIKLYHGFDQHSRFPYQDVRQQVDESEKFLLQQFSLKLQKINYYLNQTRMIKYQFIQQLLPLAGNPIEILYGTTQGSLNNFIGQLSTGIQNLQLLTANDTNDSNAQKNQRLIRMKSDLPLYKQQILESYTSINLESQQKDVQNMPKKDVKKVLKDFFSYKKEKNAIKSKLDELFEDMKKLREQARVDMKYRINAVKFQAVGSASEGLKEMLQTKPFPFQYSVLKNPALKQYKNTTKKILDTIIARRTQKGYAKEIAELDDLANWLGFHYNLMANNNFWALIIITLLIVIILPFLIWALVWACLKNIRWYLGYNYEIAHRRGEVATSYDEQMDNAYENPPIVMPKSYYDQCHD